jgi:tRNA (uracil-5-)-methyltransferase
VQNSYHQISPLPLPLPVESRTEQSSEKRKKTVKMAATPASAKLTEVLQTLTAQDSTIESNPTAPQNTQIHELNDDVVPNEKRKRDDGDENTDADGKPSLHPMWKTSLCSYFRKHASCSHGDTCRYAHSEEELRQRPDNTWDPTSERGKKALKTVTGEKIAVKDGVMMTELVGDEVDGEGGDDGFASNQALSKCLVHLPMKWSSENLRNFLNEQVNMFPSFGFFTLVSLCQN